MKTVGFKGYSVFFNFLLSSTNINRGNSFKLSTSLFSHVNLNSKGAKGHPSLKRFTFKHGRSRYGVQYFKTAFKTKISVKHRPDLPEYIKNHIIYKSTDSKLSSSSWFSNFILCYLYNMGMLKHEIFTTLFSSNLSYLIIESYWGSAG